MFTEEFWRNQTRMLFNCSSLCLKEKILDPFSLFVLKRLSKNDICWTFCPFLRWNIRRVIGQKKSLHSHFQRTLYPGFGNLNATGSHKLIGSGTIERCGFVGVDGRSDTLVGRVCNCGFWVSCQAMLTGSVHFINPEICQRKPVAWLGPY